MKSMQEKMKTMPRVKAEFGEFVVIETTDNGVTISEVVCYVQALEFDMVNNSSKVKLNVLNPSSERTTTNSYTIKN